MLTVTLKCADIEVKRNACAVLEACTNSVMIAPLPGMVVCAFIKNRIYRNVASGFPVVSPNSECMVYPHIRPVVNLNVNGTSRQGSEGDWTYRAV